MVLYYCPVTVLDYCPVVHGTRLPPCTVLYHTAVRYSTTAVRYSTTAARYHNAHRRYSTTMVYHYTLQVRRHGRLYEECHRDGGGALERGEEPPQCSIQGEVQCCLVSGVLVQCVQILGVGVVLSSSRWSGSVLLCTWWSGAFM